MPLWIPPSLQSEYAEQRVAETARLLRHLEVQGQMDHWNKLLKDLDPYLQLVKAQDNATHPWLKPGYWHIIRATPGAPPSVIIHQGDNGEYREPDSGLYEELKEGDFWSDRSQGERRKRERRIEKAKEREKEREREDRIDEVLDRYNSKHRVSALITKAVK